MEQRLGNEELKKEVSPKLYLGLLGLDQLIAMEEDTEKGNKY